MLAIAAFVLCTALLASASRYLSVNLFTPSVNVTDVDNLYVSVVVTNNGPVPVRLLRHPQSVLSLDPTEKFKVMNSDGAHAEFTGITISCSPEYVVKSGRLASYVVLDPSTPVTVWHSLAGVYDLTLTGAGAYTINVTNVFYVVEDNNTITEIYAKVATAEVNVQGKLVSSRGPDVNSAALRMNKRKVEECPDAKILIFNEAIGRAKEYAKFSIEHLKENQDGSELYNTWFGAFDRNRYDKVLAVFEDIYKDISEWIPFCDGPDGNTIAYTFPHLFDFIIYLHPIFFDSDLDGPYSKASTIIHEGTHLVRRTKDHKTDYNGCLQLAIDDPEKAIDNAENYAMFSDKTRNQ